MENELTVYPQIADPVAAATALGKQIMQSEMFGCKSASSGTMLAWECITTGKSLLTLTKQYHIIHGRLSMRAETMLALFRTDAGGKHKVLLRTPEEAAIELTCDGETNVFRITWQEALAEPFVYNGKEAEIVAKLANGKTQGLTIKPKYLTPRSRMQMLWARLISDSIRVVAPEIVNGVYPPEVIDDFAGTVKSNAAVAESDPVVTLDVKAVTPTVPAPVPVPAPAPPPPPVGPVVSMGTGPVIPEAETMCGPAMGKQIEDYAYAVKMPPEEMNRVLRKYNAGSPAGLPGNVANDLFEILKKKYDEKDIPF